MCTSRRDFLRTGLSCGAYLAAAGFALPTSVRSAFAARPSGWVRAVEPWGRIEELAEGVYAVVSTPLAERDFTTLSNGGLIVGRDGILAIEGLASPEGARWVSDFAEQTLGRRPSHVVLTHYHGDHSVGQAGYRDRPGEIRVVSTAETLRLLQADTETERLLPNLVLQDGETSTEIDLGGRVVRLIAREGHTSSDVTVQIDEPRVTWCGDLVWKGMFPNFMDARPSRLIRAVRSTLGDVDATFVPGHGEVSDRAGLQDYVEMLEHLGDAATTAFRAGQPAEEGAAAYAIPESLGEFVRFNERYYEVAFKAWYGDLGGDA
jgi:glyoxylase-like metal-dependent hydrolase (beta-lactamase superfamily II)